MGESALLAWPLDEVRRRRCRGALPVDTPVRAPAARPSGGAGTAMA